MLIKNVSIETKIETVGLAATGTLKPRIHHPLAWALFGCAIYAWNERKQVYKCIIWFLVAGACARVRIDCLERLGIVCHILARSHVWLA